MEGFIVLIVDDDPPASAVLRSFLKIEGSAVKISVANSAREAKAMLDQEIPDLIFLDINMPEEDGLEFAKRLNAMNIASLIIFTTAHRSYAVPAFQFKPIDYLVKPFGLKDVEQVIEKAKSFQTLRARSNADKDVFLKFVNNQRLIFCKPDELAYIAIVDRKLIIYKVNGEEDVLSMNMVEVEEVLPPNQFFRINRSEIVNLKYLIKVDRGLNGLLQYGKVKKFFHISKTKLPEIERLKSGNL